MTAGNSRERNTNFDILRIMACMLVILAHVSSTEIDIMTVPSWNWSISHIYNSIGHTGTVLFLFISGSLLLPEEYTFAPKKFYKNNFLKLFVAYYSWIVIYHLIGFIQRGNYDGIYIKDVIINVIKGEAAYHFWYVPMLLGIYLILPMLRAIAKAGERLLYYYVALFLIVKVIFGTVRYLNFPHKYLWESLMTRIPFTLVNDYTGYFVLGYLLFLLIKKNKIPHTKLIGAGLVIAGALGGLLGDILVTKQQGVNSITFNTLFSLTLCMGAIGIFLLITTLPLGIKPKTAQILEETARLTFGIYMIHPLIMSLVSRIVPLSLFPRIMGIPIVTILVFGVSLVMMYLLSFIPIIRKWVLFAGKKRYY